jgi:hypothetical protein
VIEALVHEDEGEQRDHWCWFFDARCLPAAPDPHEAKVGHAPRLLPEHDGRQLAGAHVQLQLAHLDLRIRNGTEQCEQNGMGVSLERNVC